MTRQKRSPGRMRWRPEWTPTVEQYAPTRWSRPLCTWIVENPCGNTHCALVLTPSDSCTLLSFHVRHHLFPEDAILARLPRRVRNRASLLAVLGELFRNNAEPYDVYLFKGPPDSVSNGAVLTDDELKELFLCSEAVQDIAEDRRHQWWARVLTTERSTWVPDPISECQAEDEACDEEAEEDACDDGSSNVVDGDTAATSDPSSAVRNMINGLSGSENEDGLWGVAAEVPPEGLPGVYPLCSWSVCTAFSGGEYKGWIALACVGPGWIVLGRSGSPLHPEIVAFGRIKDAGVHDKGLLLRIIESLIDNNGATLPGFSLFWSLPTKVLGSEFARIALTDLKEVFHRALPGIGATTYELAFHIEVHHQRQAPAHDSTPRDTSDELDAAVFDTWWECVTAPAS